MLDRELLYAVISDFNDTPTSLRKALGLCVNDFAKAIYSLGFTVNQMQQIKVRYNLSVQMATQLFFGGDNECVSIE